jgi:chitodextrinase
MNKTLRDTIARARIPLTFVAVATLLLGLLSLNNAHALTPTFVQTNSHEVATSTTDSTVFNGANTAGNLIVAYVIWDSGTSTTSMSDTQGNAYTSVAAPTKWNTSKWSSQVFYAKNIKGGANTVKATFSSSISKFGVLYVNEYSGLDTINPLDVSAAAVGTSKAMNSGSATTTNANDLLFGAGASTTSVSAPGTGYTVRSTGSGNMIEDKSVASIGSYNATATQNNNGWVMHMVAFKATPPDSTPPSVPTGLTASAVSPTQINLNWTASTDNVGVSGYKVYRNSVQIGTSTSPSYSDTGLSQGTTYTYTVAAVDAAGNTSAQSSSAAATTPVPPPDTIAPTIPANLVATAGVTQVSLTWNAATDNVGVTAYHVFRNGALVGSPATTSYQDAGLSPATGYSYTVSALDAAGNESAQTAAVNVTTNAQPTISFPAGMSANHRYLVDQSGSPYLMVGDSPQSAIGNLSVSEADRYFADRAAHGFNAVWINLLCNSYTGCNANGTTADGIKPFTTGTSPSNYDLSTPNATYFARADAIINSAAAHGITVVLDPIETGGWLATMQSNGATKDTNFGKYLGNRYKTFPNIIWMSGNDFQSWRTASDDAVVKAVATGIQSNDPNHSQSLELDFLTSSSLNDTNWANMINLNASYTYYPTYAEVLNGYNQTPTMPDFMVEANYEFEHNPNTDGGATPNLRRQEYWTMTSGATGQLYGSSFTWKIANGWSATDLDTIGVTQLGYLTSLLQGRQWYNLVPDQTHTLLTAGYGTFSSTGSIVTNDYVTAAKTPDGSLAMAYVPSTRTVTVDMSKMGGAVTAKWFDVTAGTYQTISGSPFANTGTRQFTTPGNHSDGTNDWVLVLEANLTPDTQAPTVPTNVATTPVSSSQINLSWTASTDDHAVNGYNVYRDGVKVGTSNTTSYSDTGLVDSTTYSYTVSALDAAGNESAQSTAVNGTTTSPDTTSPSTPLNVQSTNVTGSTISISWDASTDNIGVAGYNVYRDGLQVANTTQLNFSDSSLTPSTTYIYTIAAFDFSGNVSPQSAPISVTTSATLPATPQFQQLSEAHPTATSSSVSTPNFGGATQTGDANIVWVWYPSTTQSVSSVTDSAGNSYQKAIGPTTGTGAEAGWRQEIWYAKNITGSSNLVVTANFTGSFAGEKSITVEEFSGLDKTAPLDVAAAANVNSANVSSPSITTTTPKELIFSVGLFASSGTAGPGFTQRSSIANNASEDQVVTSAGPHIATYTNSTIQDVIVAIVGFKAAGQ